VMSFMFCVLLDRSTMRRGYEAGQLPSRSSATPGV